MKQEDAYREHGVVQRVFFLGMGILLLSVW